MHMIFDSIIKWIDNGHEGYWLGITMTGCVGCFAALMAICAWIDRHIGQWTTGTFAIVWIAYMFSILAHVDDYPISKWWIINAIIWFPITTIAAITILLNGIISELC